LSSERSEPVGDGAFYVAAHALTVALSATEVASAIFAHALAQSGASTASLWLLDASTLRFAAGGGRLAGTSSPVEAMPMGSDLPAAACVRTGEPVFYGPWVERDRRWLALADLPAPAEAVVVLPLVAGDGPLEELRAFVQRSALAPIEELCDAVLSGLARPGPRLDDVALLAVRWWG
jgi:hypothetical protein